MIVLSPARPARAAIDAAIDDALARIRGRAAALGDGAVTLADALTRAASGGKRFRPALVVAAFEAFGGDTDSTPGLYPVAAAFELLHTAFVVHDDVIDHDVLRRGIPNVGGEFRERALRKGADDAGAALVGDAAAILAGDLLLHEAGRLLALADVSAEARSGLFDLLDDAVLVSAAGELADVENAVGAMSADPDEILAATRNKTAVYSFSAPLAAGSVLAGASDSAREALERFGDRLGLAYQLVDDLIGAFGSAEVAGRGEGGDLREAKQTPLIALARNTDAWTRVSDALAQAHTGPVAVREAQRALADSGARLRLEGLVDQTLGEARALAAVRSVPAGARQMLLGLADAVWERIP